MGRRTLQLRRDHAADWYATDPLLEEGEPGFETDTGRLKIGDGIRPWSLLPYLTGGGVDSGSSDVMILAHIADQTPHSVYDDGPSLSLLYENAKV